MAERRPRCVLVRTHDTRTANTAVSICQYILNSLCSEEGPSVQGENSANKFQTILVVE